MTELFDKGHSYSGINVARSALSSIGITVETYTAGTHPLVVRLLKGIYNVKPPRPRYSKIWDVNVVLNYMRKLVPVKRLSLKDLTLKLVMLLSLTNATRVQTVHKLSVLELQKLKSQFVLKVDGQIKQSRPGKEFSVFNVKAYLPDRRICPYFVLKEYLERTRHIRRDSTRLFISYIKPHSAVSKDTVARWIKIVLIRSGIDTGTYGPHSVRTAATSKASIKGVPVQDIMSTAGWTNAGTFQKFYQKTVESRFSAAVLEA